jgi:hypothetical protein
MQANRRLPGLFLTAGLKEGQQVLHQATMISIVYWGLPEVILAESLRCNQTSASLLQCPASPVSRLEGSRPDPA